MTIKLYDLAAADPAIRFSPNCWRARMALAHKGLEVETIPWRFTDKQVIAFSDQGKTPIIVDGDRWVVDSWSIAEYLDSAYPDRPLFDGPQAKAYAAFVMNWIEAVVNPGVAKQVILPISQMLSDADKVYFRETREKAFGTTLEAFGANAQDALPAFRASLEPMRRTLAAAPYLCGDAPAMADYIAFGAFQWARTTAPYDVLAEGDVIAEWRERMLSVHDGVARSVPARSVA